MIGIYKITSPTNKVYVGQSVDIERRWLDHKSCYEKFPLQNSIKKHGFENHIFEILEECEIENLNERERFYQDQFDVLGPNGLNCKLTQTTDLSGSHSEETKKKIGKANKEKVLSEEIKERKLQRLRDTISNKSEEQKLITKENRAKAQRGSTFSQESKDKRKNTIESNPEKEFERRKRISQAQLKRTYEEKQEINRKIQETKQRNKNLKNES